MLTQTNTCAQWLTRCWGADTQSCGVFFSSASSTDDSSLEREKERPPPFFVLLQFPALKTQLSILTFDSKIAKCSGLKGEVSVGVIITSWLYLSLVFSSEWSPVLAPCGRSRGGDFLRERCIDGPCGRSQSCI